MVYKKKVPVIFGIDPKAKAYLLNYCNSKKISLAELLRVLASKEIDRIKQVKKYQVLTNKSI